MNDENPMRTLARMMPVILRYPMKYRETKAITTNRMVEDTTEDRQTPISTVTTCEYLESSGKSNQLNWSWELVIVVAVDQLPTTSPSLAPKVAI